MADISAAEIGNAAHRAPVAHHLLLRLPEIGIVRRHLAETAELQFRHPWPVRLDEPSGVESSAHSSGVDVAEVWLWPCSYVQSRQRGLRNPNPAIAAARTP